MGAGASLKRCFGRLLEPMLRVGASSRRRRSQASTRTGDTTVLVALLMAVALLPSGCGSSQDSAVEEPDATAPLFKVTRDELNAASGPGIQNTEIVLQALDERDGDLLLTAFSASSEAVDPIVPSLRPGITNWFAIFLRLCSGVLTHDIYVNVDGSVYSADCSGFYDGYVNDPPPQLPVLGELWLEDGRATRLMNRLDAAMLEAYPAETSDVIGFGTSKEDAVRAAAQTAKRFGSAWVEAWESGDADAIVALYSPEGTRLDGFAGLAGDPSALSAWLGTFSDTYDQVTVEIEVLTASALGPAAAYRLELSDGTNSCAMRLVSVWDLDEEDRITRENVYYDPETVLACGWEGAKE